MAAILEDDNFKCIFLYENDKISIRNSLTFVLSSPIDNKPALEFVPNCPNLPLSEPIMAWFTQQ